jgi:hypothetical protein
MSSMHFPKSIEIWICPACGAIGKDRGAVVTAPFGQQDMQSPCWRNAEHAEPVKAAYVLATPDDEMVEHIATLIAERFGGWDHEHDRWENDEARARELDWARALIGELREDPEADDPIAAGHDDLSRGCDPPTDLADLIGDAVERGLCTPLRVAEGEDVHTVRALARASAIANPDVIRRVALITRAVVDALSTNRDGGGSMSAPSGSFVCEVYCGCGAALDKYERWNGLAHIAEYADPDTGETVDACPQCGQGVLGVVADDAKSRHRADAGGSNS